MVITVVIFAHVEQICFTAKTEQLYGQTADTSSPVTNVVFRKICKISFIAVGLSVSVYVCLSVACVC